MLFAGAGGLGRHPDRAISRRPENLRWEGRTLGELIDETGTDPVDALCDLLLAEDLRARTRSRRARISTGIRRFLRHPVGMVGTDSDVRRGEAAAPDVRQLPADPRPVRARRGAPQPRGGGPADDRGAGRAPGAARTAARSATAPSRTS